MQITSLEAQAKKLETDITENESQLTTLVSDMKTLDDRIREKQEAIDIQKDILLDLFRYYYVDQSEEDEPLFFSPVEIGKFMFGKEVSAQTGDRINTTLTNLEALKQSVSDEYEVISSKKIEADTLKLQLLERNSYLESTKDNKAALLEQTKQEEKKYDTLIDKLKQEQDDIEQEINDLEAGKVGDLDLKDLPDFGKSVFIYPVKDYRFTQGYGKTSFSKKPMLLGSTMALTSRTKWGHRFMLPPTGKSSVWEITGGMRMDDGSRSIMAMVSRRCMVISVRRVFPRE